MHYWEHLTGKYNFNPNKKYMIYFKGYFGPPTAGHFWVVNHLLSQGYNIEVIIHQMGGEGRHGVPYWLNRKIWEVYIEQLLPFNRVHLLKYERFSDVYSLLGDIDTLVYVRGNESYDTKYIEGSDMRIYKDRIRRLKRIGVDMDFYYMARPKSRKISATNFIHSLIKTKYYDDHKKYNILKRYFPKNLPYNMVVALTFCYQLM